MTTLEFLQRILPSSGWYFLALGKVGIRGLSHVAYDSLEAMSDAAIQIDKNPNVTVYHACTTYNTASIIEQVDGEAKTRYRVTSNGKESKTFWLDVDCGPEKAEAGKGYAEKKDAVTAIAAFCVQTSLPLPVIVSSGNGVHFYWPLDTAITVTQWRATAEVLKACLAHCGVLADPSRTADFSSILRPIGTHHKKDPTNLREVKVVRDAADVSFADFDGAVRRYADAKSVSVQSPHGIEGDKPMGVVENDFADYGYPDVPCNPDKMAEGCAQVRFVRDTGGDAYEQWFGVMGLLKFCTDGDNVAHEWSSQSQSYDSGEVAQKLRTWSTGPSKCSYLEQRDPGKCEGCAFRGKITTPLQLAKEVPVQEEHIEEVVNEDTGRTETVVIPEPPAGYWFDAKLGGMVRRAKNRDDVDVDIQFSDLQFYPVTRVSASDGAMAVQIRIHKRDGKIKEFIMKTEVIGMGAKEVRKVLGNFEVLVTDHPRAAESMEAYLRNAIKKLMDESKEIESVSTFGWYGDTGDFLLGEQLITSTGESRDVMLVGQAKKLVPTFRNNVEDPTEWVEGVDWLYNKPGMEVFQYVICTALGSILTPFMESTYHGIPLALTGTKSAKGKTTGALVALSAWGDPEKMTLNGDEHGSTTNARFAMFGTMQNIPLLLDELSMAKAEFIGSTLYTLSIGVDKRRLVSKNGEVTFADQSEWHSSNFITSNTRIGPLLATIKSNSQAEAVRVFEIYVNRYTDGMAVYAPNEVAKQVTRITKNPGAVGKIFAQYVVQNREKVEAMMQSIGEKLLGGGEFDSQHRFYRQHAVCTLTAATLLSKMGLIRFDVKRLFDWTLAHIATMSSDVAEINMTSSEENFTSMVNELSARVARTETYGDARNTMPADIRIYGGPCSGRYISGNGHGDEALANRLYLVRKEVQDWASKNRVDVDDLLNWAKNEGIYIPIKDPRGRFNITKGTTLPTMQPPCYCFDITRIEIQAPGELKLVTPPITEKRSAGGQQ